jgi:hypothetical protein
MWGRDNKELYQLIDKINKQETSFNYGGTKGIPVLTKEELGQYVSNLKEVIAEINKISSRNFDQKERLQDFQRQLGEAQARLANDAPSTKTVAIKTPEFSKTGTAKNSTLETSTKATTEGSSMVETSIKYVVEDRTLKTDSKNATEDSTLNAPGSKEENKYNDEFDSRLDSEAEYKKSNREYLRTLTEEIEIPKKIKQFKELLNEANEQIEPLTTKKRITQTEWDAVIQMKALLLSQFAEFNESDNFKKNEEFKKIEKEYKNYFQKINRLLNRMPTAYHLETNPIVVEKGQHPVDVVKANVKIEMNGIVLKTPPPTTPIAPEQPVHNIFTITKQNKEKQFHSVQYRDESGVGITQLLENKHLENKPLASLRKLPSFFKADSSNSEEKLQLAKTFIDQHVNKFNDTQLVLMHGDKMNKEMREALVLYCALKNYSLRFAHPSFTHKPPDDKTIQKAQSLLEEPVHTKPTSEPGVTPTLNK